MSTSLALLLLPPLLGLRKRKGLARLVCMLLLMLGGAAATSLLSGCGVSGNGQAQQSYTVTVTATSGSLQHSTAVTVVE